METDELVPNTKAPSFDWALILVFRGVATLSPGAVAVGEVKAMAQYPTKRLMTATPTTREIVCFI
jgi:hypothetical protein